MAGTKIPSVFHFFKLHYLYKGVEELDQLITAFHFGSSPNSLRILPVARKIMGIYWHQ